MLARTALLFALLTASTTILSGAWFGSAAQQPPPAKSDFVAQDVPLDPDVYGIDADAVLDLALLRLQRDESGWLRTKFRHTVNGCVVADGSLQRGPNHCVRLELEVNGPKTRGRLVVVSDGNVLARVQSVSSAAATPVLEHLPPLGATTERQAFLARHGCDGPIVLLQKARTQARNATLQTGKLVDRAVIRIDGAETRVDLDAKSLRPMRIELQAPRMTIEFADFEIGRELPPEECARVFSYRPAD